MEISKKINKTKYTKNKQIKTKETTNGTESLDGSPRKHAKGFVFVFLLFLFFCEGKLAASKFGTCNL